MERKIEVSYDVRYPNSCRGTLLVKVDGIVMNYECNRHSTGSVWFESSWTNRVECGRLAMNKFKINYQKFYLKYPYVVGVVHEIYM